MKMEESVVLVTGGASGLGEACIRHAVALGGKAVILDFAEENGRRLATELGRGVLFCKTDVTDEASVQSAIDETIETFGAVHVAVNCAGVGTPGKILGKKGPLPMQSFRQVVNINLMGTVNVIRLAAEKMVLNAGNEDGEKGVIVNTASVAAFEGQIGQAAYAASKAAVVGMTLPVAREFADYGLRIVTIAPGLFETPMAQGLPDSVKESLVRMIPFPRRFGKPAEFASLVQEIIENPCLNGTTIRLDSAIRMGAR
ncbi:MAG: SDR family NAD(P)-dependent oxidoreductase [Desulfomonilaceae bacterium]|nr:SDR family NAD(P)-dependent oxidoreductase [Desulfomonilaceae bacterium]